MKINENFTPKSAGDQLCECVVLVDGVKSVPGSRRRHGSAKRRPHEEEQLGHQEVPTTHRQQQVPTVPAGARGKDGEVKWSCCIHSKTFSGVKSQ